MDTLKKISFLSFLILSIVSCSNDTTIFKKYSCNSINLDSNIENVLDADNNFSLDIPKHWKTELYIDRNVSTFTTADTTKQFSKTYLIKASLVDAKLRLDEAGIQKIKTNLTATESLKILAVNKGNFKTMPALLIRSIVKKPLEKSVLHLYAPLSKTQYFEIEIHCYGTEAVEKRLCQAIQYVNSLKINEIQYN